MTYDVLKVAREDQLSPGLSDVPAGPATVGEPVMSTSTKNGTLFLVPAATPANLSAIEAAAAIANGTSVSVTADLYGVLDTSSFASGIYVVYAVDTEGRLSTGTAGIRIISPNDMDDTSGTILYSGTWTELVDNGYFLGTMRRKRRIEMNLGVIGYGNRIKHVITALRKEDPSCVVKAVADIRNDLIVTDGAAGAAPAPVYGTPEAMLASERLDGILIGTRCSLHTEMALKVLPTGIPLFLEKPVSTTMADARRLKSGCESGKSPTVVSFPLRITYASKLRRIILAATALWLAILSH